MSDEILPLRAIAHGRSGDKGASANIGIIAYTEAGYHFLQENLTAERVHNYFQMLHPSRTERFELDGIQAINFLLHNVLEGGGSRSLRADAQGKALAEALLEMPMTFDHNQLLMMQPPQ